MSWKPTNINTIITKDQIVLVWDRKYSLLYHGVVTVVGGGNGGFATFNDGESRLVIGGDCEVQLDPKFSFSSYSYYLDDQRAKPDILYLVADVFLWPTRHWARAQSEPKILADYKNDSCAWVVGVWEPGTNYGDDYKRNIVR